MDEITQLSFHEYKTVTTFFPQVSVLFTLHPEFFLRPRPLQENIINQTKKESFGTLFPRKYLETTVAF